MKNIFRKKEVFSIRKFSMGIASVMIASSLVVSSQANIHLLKAKENIEVQVNKDINIRIIERDGGAVIELAATKDLTDVDVNVMLNGNRVTSYRIARIKAGQKIEKKVTKEQLEKIKKLISNGQKTLPNTAIVERSATQTINIAGNSLRVDVKYRVEDNSVPEVKPEESEKPEVNPTPEVKPKKPEIKPTPEVKPEKPEAKPTPEIKPEKPEVKPGNPEVKPTPEVKPEKSEIKSTPEVKPEKPEVKPTPEIKPEKPEVKPENPEVKPEKPEVKPENPEVKPEKPEIKPTPEAKPETPEEKPTPEVKPEKPEVKPTPEVKPENPSKEDTTDKNNENKVVKFEDENLKRILLKKLKDYNGKDVKEEDLAGEYNFKIKDKNYRKDKNDTEIYEKDLAQIEAFAIRGFDEETYEPFVGEQQIRSIVGLEKAVNLKQLTISGNPDDSKGALKDISPLRGLKNLELLRLSHNDITDISPVKGLTNLKHLFLSHNRIEKIDAIRNLTDLESLDFARNIGEERISDISAIANLTKLKLLGLSDANIPDISVLKNLVNLETFMANDSKIEDISALKTAKNLKLLYLDSNKITDVSVVKDLLNLKELYLRNNNISEIDFSKLTKLEDVNVQGNKIRDYSSLRNLASLKYVNISKQKIDLNKEYSLDSNSIEIDMPIIGLESQVKEGTLKVTSDNEKVKVSYDGKTNKITLSVINDVLKEYANKQLLVNLKVLYVDKEDYKSEETSIDVNNIKLNVKEKVAEPKKLVIDDLVVTNENKPVTDKLTYILVNKKNDNEVIEKNTNKGMLSGLELTKDEVYTLSLNDNEKYQMEDIDVVAKEEDGFSVLYNVKTNEIIQNLEVKKIEKEETPEDNVVTLDGITAKVTNSLGVPISNVPFRLFEYDGIIPNIIKQEKTGEDGTLTFTANKLKPNKKYELRIEKRDSAFNRENVIFTTDEDGEIVSIDNKAVTEETTGVIDFKEERKNDKEIKTIKSYYKVVDENGNPVENVELSVNGIRTKITTLKNARSNKNGIVELDLETKVNGVDYIVNVSKNDQFNWEFRPDSVNLNVSEEGNITYNDLNKDYRLEDYNGTKIPVFVVKKIDLNYLKTDLREKIKEAEAELEKSPNKELKDIVNSAKEELAKSETLPIYVKGYIGNLTTALEKIKKSKADEKPLKKGAIPEMLVRNGNTPELNEMTVEFINKNNPKDKVVAISENGMLSNVQLTVGEEYIIKVKGQGNEVLPNNLVLKEEEGEFVPYKVGTDEFYDSIDLGELKKETKEDLSEIRGELEKLVSRELRTEKGYIANEGNQPANNAWILAKTEAEKVLRNPNATKEQLENEIENLTTKTNEAIVGSEKTKVKKLIIASQKDNEDKLKLRAELNAAKTIEEVKAIAEKVGGKVTPPSGNNTETKPEKTGESNTGKTPEIPGENNTETKPEKPKTEDGNIVSIKEAIVQNKLPGKGGLLLLDVEVKNTDVNKVGLVAYRDGKKVDNVTIDKFLTESTNKVSYTITVPKNESDKEVNYKFVAAVDGKETDKYLEKTQEAFVKDAKITNYSLENEVLQGEGLGTLVLKGDNLTTSNVKIRVFNSDSVEENSTLTSSVVYEKRGNDLIAKINFPENNTNTSKSYKIKIYQNGKEVNITTLDKRDRRDKPTFTVVGRNQDSTKPVLSNLTITSYRTSGTGAVNDGVEKTETTVASNQVSKKTEVHLYGANLNEVKTKVKIVDQNGVEWPIEGAESDLIKMVLAGKSGVNNGILGNGTFQIAEIILPGNLKENMTFTYTFAVDGVNFDISHQVRAIVEKTGGQVDPVVKTITLKYQDETGKKITEDKVLKAYSHFPVSVGKADLTGYTFVKVKDISALNDRIGEKTEITYVYKNSNGDSITAEKPKVEDSNNGTQPEVNEDVKKLKDQLQNLVAKDLRTESNYKMQGTGEETAWLNSRKNSEKTLAKVNVEKTELELRIKRLTNAIETLKVANAQKNSNSPEVIPPNNNTASATEELKLAKEEAKRKVLNSEFIQDKNKYIKRIKEATTVEALRALISEIDNLNNNEGKESATEENIAESVEQLKSKLQKLVDNNLIKTEKYTQATPELQTEYRKARAFARKLLNEDTSKEKLKEQIEVLETIIKKITGV